MKKKDIPVLHDEHTRAKIIATPGKIKIVVPRKMHLSGEFTKDYYFESKRKTHWKSVVSLLMGYTALIQHPKEVAREFTKIFGHTPTDFGRALLAAHIEAFVEKTAECAESNKVMEKWIRKFSNPKARNRFPIRKGLMISSYKEIIQADKDGLYNLIPLIASFGESPKSIRELVGKGAWKKICKHSITRNLYLSKAGKYFLRDFRDLVDCPSFILKNFEPSLWRVANLAYKSGLINSSTGVSDATDEVKRLWYTYTDCCDMAIQLNKPAPDVNKTTISSLKKMHDKYSEEIRLKKFSKDQFISTKDVRVKLCEIDGYTVKMLDNAFDISQEGAEMHHCVAYYSEQVARGQYLVYSIRKGDQRSTLGVSILKENGNSNINYRIQQHYGKCNALISDEEKEIGKKIVNMLGGK